MPFYFFLWNEEIEQHLAEPGITPDEFEGVVCDPDEVAESRSSGRPMAFGETATGKYVVCIYEMLDDATVLPVTAYEVEE